MTAARPLHADSFATRRIRCLRRAIPAGLLLRPSLPAVIAENSEACPSDKAGKRMLPDSSLWVVSSRRGCQTSLLISACLRNEGSHRLPALAHPARQRVSWLPHWSTWRSRAGRTCTAPA